MENYVRSDLAAECGCEKESVGIRVCRATAGGCEILRVHIKEEEAAARIGKPCGRYVTVECGNVADLDDVAFEEVRRVLAVELKELAERMTGKRIGSGFSVMIAGLGNAEMTPDAVGPETLRRLSVTRHLRQYDTALFSTVGLCEISAVAPGVLGQTGLESVELVRGAVAAVSPDLVIAVDALAARATARLAATVQLADTGIQPGAGVGNRRRALNKDTVGVPVMALGVPTVVESATLIRDALTEGGMEEESKALHALLENGRGFFVAPKNIDVLVPSVGKLLAEAIEKAFSV